MTLRIIATADNHLGRTHARMPIDRLDQRRRRIRRAFGQAVDYAIERRAHLFLLAGDLFDNPNPRNPERVYLACCLLKLARAGVQVAAIGGNHDAPRSKTEEGGYLPLAVYHELDALCFFDQLDDDRIIKPVVFQFDGFTIAVGGFTPNTNLPADADQLAGVTFAETGADFGLLLVHAGIEGTMFPGNEALIMRESLARLRGVDLVVAGNVHSYESFPLGQVHVVIPGATEWMDFGESKSVTPGFAEIEVNGRGALSARQIEAQPQPRAEMCIKTVELNADDPTSMVLARLEFEAGADTLGKLVIEGALDRQMFAKIDFSVIEERARDLFFFCEFDYSGLNVQADSGLLRVSAVRRSISEEIDHEVNRLLEKVDYPRERESLEMTCRAIQAKLQELEQ